MRLPLTLIALLAVAAPASAGDVQLEIRDGRVWMTATNATVAEILSAWARVGGTTIVNGEKLGGASLTLELNDVPEKEALDVVLRSASGYMAVNRTAAGGSSAFDRILILANSVAPREAPRPQAQQPFFVMPEQPMPQPVPGAAMPGQEVQRLIGPDGLPVPDDQEDGPPPFVPPSFVPPAPFGFSNGDAPPNDQGQPANPSSTPQLSPGAAAPGMIVPAPNQPPPGFRPQP